MPLTHAYTDAEFAVYSHGFCRQIQEAAKWHEVAVVRRRCMADALWPGSLLITVQKQIQTAVLDSVHTSELNYQQRNTQCKKDNKIKEI